MQLVVHPQASRRRLRRGRGPALRARRLRRGRDRQARARERQPEPRHRRHRDPRALAAAPGRQRDAALRRRRGRAGRRDAAPAAPHARPAPRAHARGDGAAPRRRGHHARRPQRARLPGDRDADPHALDARGRARLPRPQPPAAGLVVRAAAVAPAVQAAADDERLRALLPDRPLLPRRGPARRPPARVHPARRRDGLRRRGRRHRDDRGRHERGVRGGELRRAADAVAAHALRRGDAALRLRPPRHRASSSRSSTSPQALRGSEFKVFESVLGGGGAVRALNAGAREMSRSELEGLNEVVQRHGGKAVAWGFVEDGAMRSPIAKFLGEDRVAAAVGQLRRVRGRPAAVRRRPAAGRGRGARRPAPGARTALRPDPRGRPRRAVGRRLPDVRAQRRRLGRRAPPVHGAQRRLRRSRRDALARLRPHRRRLGARRRLDPHQHARGPGAGLQGHRHERGGGPAALRLPARRPEVRRPAARRHRAGPRPRRGACSPGATRSATSSPSPRRAPAATR